MRYKVEVVRTSCTRQVVEVEADNETEAEQAAILKAGETAFSEEPSLVGYEVDYVVEVD